MDPKEVLAHYTETPMMKEIMATREYMLPCDTCVKKDVCRYLHDVNTIAKSIANPIPRASTPFDMSFLDILVTARVGCKYYDLKRE